MPGDGTSSSSAAEVGDSTYGALVYFSLVAREEPDFPLAMELTSALSLLEPSRPARTDPEALGLSVDLSSDELLILLRIEDLMDLEELSFVSDLEMEGYCCRVSGRFCAEELFSGVLVPSLLFDCCWPIEHAHECLARRIRQKSEKKERSRRF